MRLKGHHVWNISTCESVFLDLPWRFSIFGRTWAQKISPVQKAFLWYPWMSPSKWPETSLHSSAFIPHHIQLFHKPWIPKKFKNTFGEYGKLFTSFLMNWKISMIFPLQAGPQATCGWLYLKVNVHLALTTGY